jgi:ABC-2 type transport system permease protein
MWRAAMKRIWTIVSKEWADLFRNRLVVISVLFIPLVFTVIPVLLLLLLRSVGANAPMSEIPQQARALCPASFTLLECFQLYVVNQFALLFMFTPLIVPVSLAAYSIVGEKTTHSLEPLLASPITTEELLVGKNLAAAVPATVGTWFSVVVYGLVVQRVIGTRLALVIARQPAWWLAILVVGPLLSVLSCNFSLMVSSRVNEPHVAEQLSAVVVLPLLVLFLAQVVGLVILNRELIVALAAALIVLDALLFRLATRLFDRETILTRWG